MIGELIEERKEKLRRLQARGLNPYPSRARRDLTLAEVQKRFPALAKGRKAVNLAGRLKSIRDQGGVIFVDLEDSTGRLQGVLKKNSLPDFYFWRENIDRGDFVAASGPLFKTKRGEKSLEIKKLSLLAKTLRPIPDEFYGLHDVETRLRQRYLDFLANPELREMFVKKNRFWEAVREFLKNSDFLEIENPVLEAVPGGADAEPFITHHNALNTDYYLRISLEIALKKLLVGGFEKIFEVGRVFRNEGIDAEHLQDYTQMELYWAYADYKELMAFVEKLYKFVIKKTCGASVTYFRGEKLDWGKKWKVIDYYAVFKEKTGLDLKKTSRDELFLKAQKIGLAPERNLGRGRLIDLIYKKEVRPTLVQPSFLIDQPAELAPLAKRKADDPEKVERFQILAAGTELGNGFSEANDPVDERVRFEEQMKLRERGDKEAQRLDEDFLEALEYGMPPTAGFGLSERVFAVLMDKPIRETVTFPLLRRKE